MRDGDYLPDGKGGFCRAEGRAELLQRVLWKLTARRGQFPFLPRLGSRLYTLTREKPSAWVPLARQYAAEAEGRLALAVRLDGVMGGQFSRTAVILFFVANEGLSVLENLGLMGVPYPAFSAGRPGGPAEERGRR